MFGTLQFAPIARTSHGLMRSTQYQHGKAGHRATYYSLEISGAAAKVDRKLRNNRGMIQQRHIFKTSRRQFTASNLPQIRIYLVKNAATLTQNESMCGGMTL